MEGNESYLTQDELNRVTPLVVAIVGPTNEGKTSILRTLTNDPEFGCVNAYTGTTIRAEMQRVFCRGAAEILQLIDTPGFQTSSEILENVTENSLAQDQDGEYTLADILAAIPTEDEDFRHDLRAWREIEKCDVVLFVANIAEDPRRSLLKSTITLLQHIGKPTLVAYNNLGVQGDAGGTSADFRKEWDATLFQKRFFLVQCYDAHRRVFSDEVALFEKLVALSRDPLTRRVLRMELEDRKARERRRLEESRRIIAELLLDVATCRYEASNVDSSQLQGLLKQLQGRLTESVMRRELKAQAELLKTWGFRPSVLNRELLQVEGRGGSQRAAQERRVSRGDDRRDGGVGCGYCACGPFVRSGNGCRSGVRRRVGRRRFHLRGEIRQIAQTSLFARKRRGSQSDVGARSRPRPSFADARQGDGRLRRDKNPRASFE